jgi:hypothetical protein
MSDESEAAESSCTAQMKRGTKKESAHVSDADTVPSLCQEIEVPTGNEGLGLY